MFDLFKKRKNKTKIRKSSPGAEVPVSLSVDSKNADSSTPPPVSISEEFSVGDISSIAMSEYNHSTQAPPSEEFQPPHEEILSTTIGGGEAEQTEESKSEEGDEEYQQEDLGWGRKTTEKKEEQIAAHIKRRRGLQEEDFTESSMPVRRPVRHACQKCHLDIEINDTNHRIICDDRGKHYFCRQCITSHVEAWVNGEEEYELRQVRVGSGRGTYALQCFSNECDSGCLQEAQLRPLLDPPLYARLRQRLLQARTEQPSGSSKNSEEGGRDAELSEMGNSATPDEHSALTFSENNENPFQAHMAENPRQSSSQLEKEIELGDPRDIVREWKRERYRGLQRDVIQPYQALLPLEQKILRSKHRLFQQQLGSFRSTLSGSDLPPDNEVPTRSPVVRRATTIATSNVNHSPPQQRSSVRSLPCLRGLEDFFDDDDLPPEPVEDTAPDTAPTQVMHHERSQPSRSSLPQPSGSSFPIGAPEALTNLVDPVQCMQLLPSDSHQSHTPSAALTSITCQCCYEEVPASDDALATITCDPHLPNAEAHSFCAKCVRLYVEEWLFGAATIALRPGKDRKGEPTLVVPCLFGGCVEGGFSDRELKKALPSLTVKKFKEKISPMRSKKVNDEERLLQIAIRLSLDQQEKQKRVEEMRQEQLELSFSDIPEGLISVGVPAQDDGSASSTSSLPGSSSNTTNSQRRRRRSSKTDPNQDNYEKSLHEVEEAMSQAKFRVCPKCKTKFLKDEDFCNKLKCPSCATCICYICREVVPSNGYDHFCKHRRGGCKDCADKYCALWTDAEQDNERDLEEMRERGLDTANRIWAESLLENTPGAHPEIRVDVDKILQKPPPSTDST